MGGKPIVGPWKANAMGRTVGMAVKVGDRDELTFTVAGVVLKLVRKIN